MWVAVLTEEFLTPETAEHAPRAEAAGMTWYRCTWQVIRDKGRAFTVAGEMDDHGRIFPIVGTNASRCEALEASADGKHWAFAAADVKMMLSDECSVVNSFRRRQRDAIRRVEKRGLCSKRRFPRRTGFQPVSGAACSWDAG